MKLFGWMQSKLANAGRQANKKPDPAPTTHHRVAKQEPREEFSDWPHSLLAIGTFGNTDLKERAEIQEIQELPSNPSSSPDDFSDFTPEEVGKLQKELTKLLTKKPAPDKEKQVMDLPLDRFLNCPSSLEVDRRISNALCGEPEDLKDGDDIDRTISVIIGKCKEICADKRKKDIGKRSISFLLKKMFVCSGGFAPAPSLRDSLQESRMEKLLRTILHKKIFAQNASRAASNKKFIEDKQTDDDQDEMMVKGSDGKWVKTDSEYETSQIHGVTNMAKKRATAIFALMIPLFFVLVSC